MSTNGAVIYAVTPHRLLAAMRSGIGRTKVPRSGFIERLDCLRGLDRAAAASRTANALRSLFRDGERLGPSAFGFTPAETRSLSTRFAEPAALRVDVDVDSLGPWRLDEVLAIANDEQAIISFGSLVVPLLSRAAAAELGLIVAILPQLWDVLPLS